jgi:hypothetical protein
VPAAPAPRAAAPAGRAAKAPPRAAKGAGKAPVARASTAPASMKAVYKPPRQPASSRTAAKRPRT